MRIWRGTFIVFVVIVLITAACGGGSPAGGSSPSSAQSSAGAAASGGSPAGAGGSSPSSAQSSTGAVSGGGTSAVQPSAAQPAKAAGSGTKKTINLSVGDQPGSSIKSKVADSIKVGRKIDAKKPEISDLLWTMPPDTPKIYFGFTAKNTEERAFTQRLFINGSEINIQDLKEVPVEPPPPGKKLFVAEGLAVKPGNSFPVGDYRVDVYSQSDGKLIQSTDWNIKEKKPAAATWNIGSLLITAAAGTLWNSAHTEGSAPIDPSIFAVEDVPDVPIDENFQYYDENDLAQAYTDQAEVDEQYEPFPADVQQAIEVQSDKDNASQCEQVGGTYDALNDLCTVNENPDQACQDLGGTYQDNNCFFFPADEIPLSQDIQQAIVTQSNQDNASLCQQGGGTYDATNDLCQASGDSTSISSDEATPTPEGGEAAPTPESPVDTSAPTPPAPAPTSPQGDITTGSRDVSFNWEAVPDTTGVTYSIEVTSDDDNSVTPVDNIDGTSQTVTLNGNSCNYHWRVKAVQNGADGPWSAPISFSICTPQ